MKKNWEKFTDKFGQTILHPQFIMLSYTNEAIKEIIKSSKNKKLIDLGCGRMPYRSKLEPVVKKYTGVDHPEVSKLYDPQKQPEIIADITKKIPVKNNEFDIALLLQVLEYLENPIKALTEINRILKANGVLILTSPFLYPIHDSPYDRNRFTEIQLSSLLKTTGFKIKKIVRQGNFLSFYLQSLNVFLLKSIMDILKSKKTILNIIYLALLIIVTPGTVIITNSIFIVTRNTKTNLPNYFPLNYLVVATKQSKS